MSAYTYARQYIKSIRYFNLKFMGQKKKRKHSILSPDGSTTAATSARPCARRAVGASDSFGGGRRNPSVCLRSGHLGVLEVKFVTENNFIVTGMYYYEVFLLYQCTTNDFTILKIKSAEMSARLSSYT